MKLHYKIYAHTAPESAVDAFEEACRKADYVPYEEELGKAKYAGMEVELLVEFDTETKEFKIRQPLAGVEEFRRLYQQEYVDDGFVNKFESGK